MESNVTVSSALFNTIVQYLANRPYVEVAGLIEKIQQELKPKEPLENKEN